MPTPELSDNPMDFIKNIETILNDTLEIISKCVETDELKTIGPLVNGKKSPLIALRSKLKDIEPGARKEVGKVLTDALDKVKEIFEEKELELIRLAELNFEKSDLTENFVALNPIYSPTIGALHPVTLAQMELEDIFIAMGFNVMDGPEAETDWYNFEALNIPKDHPARGMWDTFYLNSKIPETILMRAHTSPVQVRVMKTYEPPIYTVMPGRCFRRDTPDARHLAIFHQIEGLVIDKGINFGHLAGTIEQFTTNYFGPNIHARLRPAYFPFTEPSAEFEITCTICGGDGCRTCSLTGWIELGGCGMVDPEVFKAVGIDPEIWTGFAFGFGIDRLVQMKYSLSDMRDLTENDLRLLLQF
jgi:phenylalanyl-tRNA synthetase alpha chain